jgi:hypothetical protein
MTLLWVLPACPLRQWSYPITQYYMMPLGIWQYWTMFAPDPVRESITVEAELTDSKGLRHTFDFPRLADYSTWQGIPRFRHSKYAANLSDGEFELTRKFAARHAIRNVKIPADAFPVEAHLLYNLRLAPPLGSSTPDPMVPAKSVVIGHFQFESAEEIYR